MASTSARKSSKPKPNETEALKKISSMVNRSLDLNSILVSALETTMHSLGMDGGVFRLRATPDATPKAICRGFSKEVSAVFDAANEKTVPLQPSATVWPRDAGGGPLHDAFRKSGIQFFALYPIRCGNRLWGNLGLAATGAKRITDSQEVFVSALCEILGVAISNAQLREQSNKLSEDLIALQEVNKIISQGFNLEDIIHRIVIEGKRLAKTSQCHLFLLDDQSQCLVGSASTQTENLDIRTVKIPFSEASTAVTALVEKRVIAIEDISRAMQCTTAN